MISIKSNITAKKSPDLGFEGYSKNRRGTGSRPLDLQNVVTLRLRFDFAEILEQEAI